MAQTNPNLQDPRALFEHIDELRQKNDWDSTITFAESLPEKLESAWLPVADSVAFAFGQRGEHDRAIALFERTHDSEPTYRRASAIAYLHYAAALARKSGASARRDKRKDGKQGKTEPAELEPLRVGFRRWIAQALRLHPRSVKDLYRLGIFEAQIESCHDKPALRAFASAIDSYRTLTPKERLTRHDLRKYYVRALYAAGRSALRLGSTYIVLARRCAFTCIREDATTDYLEPVHKLGLGGRVCLASEQLDPAERAFRLALDAKGPPVRDYLYGYLAEVARRRGQYAEAVRWIDAHVRPERRSAALWRQLGDLEHALENLDAAESCYRAAVLRDRTGRHLTFVRLAETLWAKGDVKGSERAFRDALDFRRRAYQSDDRAAIFGLAQLLEARGRSSEAEELRKRLQSASRDHRSRHAERGIAS